MPRTFLGRPARAESQRIRAEYERRGNGCRMNRVGRCLDIRAEGKGSAVRSASYFFPRCVPQAQIHRTADSR